MNDKMEDLEPYESYVFHALKEEGKGFVEWNESNQMKLICYTKII